MKDVSLSIRNLTRQIIFSLLVWFTIACNNKPRYGFLDKPYRTSTPSLLIEPNLHSHFLYMAALEGNVEVVAELLADPRVQVNARNNNGYTSLQLATLSGHVEVVERLLADPRVQVNAEI